MSKRIEKCGACGSRKTSILGEDNRIGKTCGNEDCCLHLSVIEWAPAPPPEAVTPAADTREAVKAPEEGEGG